MTDAEPDGAKEADGDTTADNTAEKMDNKPPVESLDPQALHSIFWGLQKSLAYPPRVLDPPIFAEFKSAFEATLMKFQAVPKVMANASVDQEQNGKRQIAELDEYYDSYNPKYLTSRELFELEVWMMDLNVDN